MIRGRPHTLFLYCYTALTIAAVVAHPPCLFVASSYSRSLRHLSASGTTNQLKDMYLAPILSYNLFFLLLTV